MFCLREFKVGGYIERCSRIRVSNMKCEMGQGLETGGSQGGDDKRYYTTAKASTDKVTVTGVRSGALGTIGGGAIGDTTKHKAIGESGRAQ